MIKINLVLICCFAALFTKGVYAQRHTFDVGIRFQKTVDLYYENGLTAQYNLTQKWAVGASYYTSRLGSALGTNAITQDNFIGSATYYFRSEKLLRPFLRGNIGYFSADYESELFENLANSSAIISADAGLMYRIIAPLKISLSIGYNAITGEGDKGAGTLYPVFYQTSLTWNLPKTFSK
ncbi:MAG: hypothetical protein V4687_19435 [Bacteroidota bacterium]